MFALVLGALRSRLAQTVTVLLLTVLACAAATASPWYLLASARRAAVAEVDAAPAAQRMLSVRRITTTSTTPQIDLANFRASVERLLPLRGPDPVLGMVHALSGIAGSATVTVPVAYRDGFCAHLRLNGACPQAAGEVVISQYTAEVLGVDVGGELALRESPTTTPVRLRIVGRYELAEPDGPYWADPIFGRSTGGSGDVAAVDPVFVAIATFGAGQLPEATFAYDAPLPDAMIRGAGGYDLAGVLRQTDYDVQATGFYLVTPAQELVALIASDRAEIRRGVLVGTAQVIVLCWFALGIAGRYTARGRRHDVALLKLRGATRTRILRLAAGQHLLPMLAGLVVGAAVGFLTARSLAGPVTEATEVRQATLLCALAVGATVLGGLLVLVLTELAALRAPVATLLRRVPPARRGWRSDLIDLVLIVVAAAGVYQARVGGVGQGSAGATGLALAASTLVALAVALLLARLLGHLADRGGVGALRAGRLRLGLAALQISRRPGMDRVFALLAVAVAVLGTAAGGWAAGAAARVDATTADLGADRVLTVQATNRTALLRAVEHADPQGHEAMAVIVNRSALPPVLAVDSARLPAVAAWRAGYGPVTALADALAHAPGAGAALPPVTGAGLSLRARNDSPQPVRLVAQLENRASGAAVAVTLGPVARGVHEVSAPVAGCAGPAGCRLLRMELLTTPESGTGNEFDPDGPPPATPRANSLTVLALSQRDPAGVVLDATALGDGRRWRASTSGVAMTVLAKGGALTLIVPGADPYWLTPPVDNRVFVVDTPLPLPIVLAGPLSPAWVLGDPTLDPFGGGSVPVRIDGTVPALPVLGRAGVLIDLGATQSVVANAGIGGTFQVWLAAGAPDAVVDRLREAGLTVLADDSLAQRQRRLAERGPAVADLYQLLAGAVGLLLAAAALGVAVTVDRTAHAGDLHALRTQGLRRGTAVAAGYAGYATLIVAAVLSGVLASVVADSLVTPSAAAPSPAILTLVGLAALVGLGAIWWASVAPLGRELRGAGRPSR